MADQPEAIKRALVLRGAMARAHRTCGELSNRLCAVLAELHRDGMPLHEIAQRTGLSVAGVEFMVQCGYNPDL